MRKIEKKERLVVNISTTPFEPFLVDGKPLTGQSFLQLDDTFAPGTGFHVYRWNRESPASRMSTRATNNSW